MIILEEHLIQNLQNQIRFSDYPVGKFKLLPSRKSVKKAIKEKRLLLNGKSTETGRWVQNGDLIQLIQFEIKNHTPFPLILEVVYEDNWLAVINKPAGIAVSGNKYRTIHNCLKENLQESIDQDKLAIPQPVHRLDYSTSGLLLVAKTLTCRIKLGKLFENCEIDKTYAAIVIGNTPIKFKVEKAIGNLPSFTRFETINQAKSLKNGILSILKCYPKTGRTHQIRIHLSSSGYPIFGDKLYGIEGEIYKGKGLFLAAIELKFKHPINNNDIAVNLPIPNKFESLMKREQRRWDKYNSAKN